MREHGRNVLCHWSVQRYFWYRYADLSFDFQIWRQNLSVTPCNNQGIVHTSEQPVSCTLVSKNNVHDWELIRDPEAIALLRLYHYRTCGSDFGKDSGQAPRCANKLYATLEGPNGVLKQSSVQDPKSLCHWQEWWSEWGRTLTTLIRYL